MSAQLARIYGGAILFTIAEAEASRDADVAFAVVTAVTVDGKRGFVAHGGSLPPKPSYTVAEQIVSVNVSHLCRLLRADAAKVGLDLRDRFLPPPNSAAFAEIVRPYAELESGIIEAKAIKKRDVAARRAGDRARMIAMVVAFHIEIRQQIGPPPPSSQPPKKKNPAKKEPRSGTHRCGAN